MDSAYIGTENQVPNLLDCKPHEMVFKNYCKPHFTIDYQSLRDTFVYSMLRVWLATLVMMIDHYNCLPFIIHAPVMDVHVMLLRIPREKSLVEKYVAKERLGVIYIFRQGKI